MAPSISVYLLSGRIYVSSEYAASRAYIAKDPVFVCSSCDVASIGENVRKGIAAFEPSGPWPIDWDNYDSPILKATGLSTYDGIDDYQDCISINLEGEVLHFYTLCPHIFLPVNVRNERIGHAVLRAFGTSYERELKRARQRRDR